MDEDVFGEIKMQYIFFHRAERAARFQKHRDDESELKRVKLQLKKEISEQEVTRKADVIR